MKRHLPKFPGFVRITLKDKHWYNEFYKNFPPYADFSFGNLMNWLNQHDDLEGSNLNGNLVLRCTNIFMNDERMYCFLGNKRTSSTLESLFEYLHLHNEIMKIRGVPETTVNKIRPWSKKRLIIQEDRDNFEYILDVNKIAYLSGSDVRKLRREVRTFLKDFGSDVLLREINLKTETAIEVHNHLLKWERAFSHNDSSKQEAKVIDMLFANRISLDYGCIGLYVAGILEGIAIYQKIPQKKCVVLNHIKVSNEYRYMFDFLIFATAGKLKLQGVQYINFEQDLGIEGLREHKLSLKPVDYLKKYSISQK